ncbi:hypothetical protein AYI68_g5528, partial [Smittium mucronatum]
MPKEIDSYVFLGGVRNIDSNL